MSKLGRHVSNLSEMIAYLRDEVGAQEQTSNGFIVQVKGTRLTHWTVYVILTEEYLLFSAPLIEVSQIEAQHAISFTIQSPFGLSIMNDSYVLKHMVSMDGMNKEKFLKEVSTFVAGVEIVLPTKT